MIPYKHLLVNLCLEEKLYKYISLNISLAICIEAYELHAFCGVLFVSKLCILLIGQFSTKNRLDIFSNKILHRFLYKFISGRFFDNKISS